MPALAVLLAAALAAAPSPMNTEATTDPVDAWRAQRAAALQDLAAGVPATPAARVTLARRALDAGLAEEALALLDADTDAVTTEPDGLLVRAEALAALARFTEVGALANELAAQGAVFAHLLQADLAGVQRVARAMKPGDPRRTLALAEILRRTNDPPGAEALFREALAAGAPESATLLGLSRCVLRQGRTDEALEFARRAALAAGSRAATLEHWAQCLSRAGRTREAVMANIAVAEGFPWSEGAHYQLGNGSALLSYSELEAAAPDAFPRVPSFVTALAEAQALALRGDVAAAREALVRLDAAWPAATEPAAILASLAWNDGDLDLAEQAARESLRREPRHGRAHAVLARVIESRRLAIDIHRATDEAAFAAQGAKVIAGLDRFVTNWSALSERHQKRVTLSVMPLAAYVPVLVEGGQTYTIKLLHQRLSETPGHEPLRDQRISYDARLWDDVRGCGGNDTVTGIEDVERTIHGGYDTVLHELAHQVHHVLPEVDAAAIERLFAAATARQAAGHDTFLSRYQASSSWEYFAEGVHGASVARRDRWDDREIRADRLGRLDLGLLRFVKTITQRRDVSASRAPALVGQALREAEFNRLDTARSALERARAIASDDEAVISSSIAVHLWAGEPEAGLAESEAARAAHPRSGRVALQAVDALIHARGDRSAALTLLTEVIPQVDEGRRVEAEVMRAGLLAEAGSLDEAEAACRVILAEHEDEPGALHVLLGTLGLRATADPAVVQDVAGRTIRRRSGSPDVRSAAALAFARAGLADDADREVGEALLLASDADEVLATAALVDLLHGRPVPAASRAQQALLASRREDGTSWNDVASLVAALAGLEGRTPGAAGAARATLTRFEERARRPPEYHFVVREHEHRSVHRAGPLERGLAQQLAARLATDVVSPTAASLPGGGH